MTILTTQKNTLRNTMLVLFLGICLGIFSKWLDALSTDSTILLHRVIDFLDLRNILSGMPIWLLLATAISVYSSSARRAALHVFLFFLGMNISYHMYTIYFCGFNPKSYMMIWYTITFLSPIPAVCCWYAKKDNKLGMLFRVLILTVMLASAFYIDPFSIYVIAGSSILFFSLMILLLWKTPKDTAITLACAVFLRILLSTVFFL